MIDSIVTRLEKIDPAKAELVKARRHPGEEFARRHLTSEVEVMLGDLFKGEVSSGKLNATQDLKFDLNLFRAYKGGYTIRDISDRLPAASTGFEPPRSRGYPPEVAAIDVNAPHSMHDLRDYLADRFTMAALDRAIAKGYVVEVHVGGELEALTDIKNRGWRLLGEVKSPNGSYERLLVTESPTGEVRYVVTGTIDGMDRVRHLSSLLRFAGSDGQGIASSKVEIVGDVEAFKARQVEELRSGLGRIGLEGSTAIVGFRGAIRTELLERALARRGAEHLRDVLGADPIEGLKAKLRAEREGASGAERAKIDKLLSAVEADKKLAEGLRREPGRVFREVKELKALQTAEKTLVGLQSKYGSQTLDLLLAEGKLRLPGGAAASTATISRTIDFGPLRAEDVRVKTAGGKTETLRLVNNYYGDTMGSVIRALLETGHTKLAYFGTAGGTADGARVGDIHVPKDIYDWRNELTSSGVRNGFLDYFEGKTTPLGERLKLGTKLGNVFSPAVETMGWLNDVKGRGLQAIEVENSYIAAEVARFNQAAPAERRASLLTSVIISDVPGSELTLGNNNGATTSTFERMLDHYLDALGISDLELQVKEDAKAPGRPLARDEHRRRALEVADKLVPKALAKSSLMRDRLAGIIDRLSLEELEAVDTSKKKLGAKDILGLTDEERARLDKEIKNPYTDAELYSSLEKADALLSRTAAELAKAYPNADFELRVGGGLERGSYSPVDGLTVEVSGPGEVRAGLNEALSRAREGLSGAPEVRAGSVGSEGVGLSKRSLLHEAQPLVGEFVARAMNERGVHHRGSRVEYSGRQHDPLASDSELFSRYESYETGPAASADKLARFREKVLRQGGTVELVPSSDPRLRGGQGRTLIDAEGKVKVLLPSDREVRSFALIDELTHVHQIEAMRRELGTEAVRELFRQAEAGDPAALARLVQWEIKAKQMVRLTLAADAPERALIDREIERLRRVLDPYLDARQPDGRIDWTKAKAMARQHAEGAASFLLGLFLKDLARVVQTGDREVIGHFFDGLATTEFWKEYGLFVVGAEAGTVIYQRYLARFVRPAFVSGVLKSNVALATGMALPALLRGDFDGKTFAINFTGLMLSSAAVQAGIAVIKWVKPLGAISRYEKLATFLKVARGVPGWVYAGVETAVVLYFADEISGRLNRWVEELETRRDVARSAESVLAAAARATDANDPALQAALDESGAIYARWRDRSLAPAMEATARFNQALNEAAKEAGQMGTGVERFNSAASRYENLRGAVDRVNARNDQEVEKIVGDALARFERERADALRKAYQDNRRSGAYDPVRGARDVSDNRAQAYEDEAALYEAAASRARSPQVAALLRSWAQTTREIAARERALLDPDYSTTRGATDALRGIGR
ncbi:MAG: hypothetical protein AB7N76_15795 [Planctomycetota bacterium]